MINIDLDYSQFSWSSIKRLTNFLNNCIILLVPQSFQQEIFLWYNQTETDTYLSVSISFLSHITYLPNPLTTSFSLLPKLTSVQIASRGAPDWLYNIKNTRSEIMGKQLVNFRQITGHILWGRKRIDIAVESP